MGTGEPGWPFCLLIWCQEEHSDLPSSGFVQCLSSRLIGNCSSPCGPGFGMVHKTSSKELQGLFCGPALVSPGQEGKLGQAWVGLAPGL